MRRVEAAFKDTLSKRWLGAALVLSLPIAATGAAPEKAPELPTDPVLASLIEQSLAARPELAQAHALAKAERERIPQAGALPDPMLQLGVQNDSFTTWNVGKMETSWYSIMASQTFPWPGKRRLRSEIVEIGARQADQSVARLRLSTEADVRRSYLNLTLARDRLALLDRLDALWQKSAAVARSRYETGQGAQSDVLRAQLELNRIRQRRFSMRADADSEVQTLNRLRGHTLDEAIESIHLVDLPMPTLREVAELAQDAIDRSPELASARLGTEQSEKSVALARKSPWPDLAVSLGVMPRGGEFAPMWLANVGIPLPIYSGSKQERAVAENEARALGNKKDVEALEQVLRLRAQQRRTALAAALETVHLYRDGLLVQSEATANSTLAQYEVGKVTFASVLEANIGLVSDQDGYLQALAQAHRLEIERAEVSLNPPAGASAGMGGGSAAVPGAGAMGGGASPSASPGAAPSAAGSSATSGM